MTLYYGPAYYVDPWVVGGLVIAAGMLAMLTITGALSLALGEVHQAKSLRIFLDNMLKQSALQKGGFFCKLEFTHYQLVIR